MIKKIIYGLLGAFAWFFTLIALLQIIVLILVIFLDDVSNPGGLLGALTFNILLLILSYWIGKVMFEAGQWEFIKKIERIRKKFR